MKIIIYDFEVYKHDTLLGTIILEGAGSTLYQTWNEDEMRAFYLEHKNDIWIGHNNFKYDDIILDEIVNHRSAYAMNDKIINKKGFVKCHLPLYSWDLMTVKLNGFPLKLSELVCGKNIHTTDVDFKLDRPLTQEEKTLTEGYNADDLYQTLYNFNMFYSQFKLRCDIITEFKLDLMENLKATGTKLAANVLGAKADPTLPYKRIKPIEYPCLQLKNERLWEFYRNEEFREGKNDVITVCGTDISIGAGGAHSAVNKFNAEKIMYFDVSGYYNLVMINFDLLPRTMPEESKKKYEFMYHEQLRLKKIDPLKRAMYKTILLSVFGAMNNPYTDFYDPQKALLVTITGQLFIVDLLEKLDGLIKVVQVNTDGIMVVPLDWNNEQKIIGIVEEWEKRTGFVIKKEYRYNLWQRDVNNYVCADDKGNLEYKGEALVNYDISEKAYATGKIFDNKEPSVIAKGIINFLIYGKTAEETVEEYKHDLRNFQYGCKKNSYDYLSLDVIKYVPNENGKYVENLITSDVVNPVCRAFAKKIFVNDADNSYEISIIKKHKNKLGKISSDKVSNLPDSVFIYNYAIDNDTYDKISDQIDWDYYVNRINERIMEFV